MRNFILTNATSDMASGPKSFDALAAGQIGICSHSTITNSDKYMFYDTAEQAKALTRGMIVLARAAKDGGPVVLPFYKHHVRYSKMKAESDTIFDATVSCNAPTENGDYTLLIVKKGVKFNERNRWTVTIRITDTTKDATYVAKKLNEEINRAAKASEMFPVIASFSEDEVYIEAKESGVDFELIPADMLSYTGTTVSVEVHGWKGQSRVDYIKELASKAAADAGIEYTQQDAVDYLYPTYPLNPLASDYNIDNGFTIFTLQFSEPREMKTVDQVVNQIVQIAVPNTSSGAAGAAVAQLTKFLAALV